MILYRNYPYSPLATIFSAFSFMFAALGIVGAIALFKESILGAVILGAIGLACGYEYFTHKIADSIARKYGKRNIETKARYGRMYVVQHPEQYDYIVSVNEAFANNFVRNEEGRIVRKK